MKTAKPNDMKRSPAKPDDEETDFRDSLRPPTRDSSQRSKHTNTTSPADPRAPAEAGGGTNPTTDPSDGEGTMTKKKKKKTTTTANGNKTKTKKAKASSVKKEDGAVEEGGAVGTSSSPAEVPPKEPQAKKAASKSAKKAKMVTRADGPQDVARSDVASVMSDVTDDNGTSDGVQKKSKAKAVRPSSSMASDDEGKAQSRTAATAAAATSVAAAAASTASVASASSNNKSRSSGGKQVVRNTQSLKEQEKERRSEAMSRMNAGQDDSRMVAGSAPTALARQITPGAFHVQPTNPSSPSSATDLGAEGSDPQGDGTEYATDVIDAEAHHVPYQSGLDSDQREQECSLSERRTMSTESDGDASLMDSSGDGLTTPIVAEIVPNDEEMAQRLEAEMKEKVKMEVDARLEQERKSQVVAEAVHVHDDEDHGRFSKRTKLIVLSLACVIVIIIVVVVGVAAGSSAGSPAGPTTDAPSSAPTIVATDDFTLMVNTIGDLVSSDPAAFFQGNDSPQFAAMDWLANEDTYDASDTQILVERYVMALLYFSTSGESWESQFSFLEPISVCEWRSTTVSAGVSCAEGPFITAVQMEDQSLRGKLPTELGLLNSLVGMSFKKNFLQGLIPAELFALTNLVYINLEDNDLTGTIPSEIGMATPLSFLDLAENLIEGKIPEELYNLVNLDTLDLNLNKLTGTISTRIGQLTSLATLDLGVNQLTGTLPTEIGSLYNVTTLYTERNDIGGQIPSEFGFLLSLQTVWLSDNKFQGTVPLEWANLGNLNNVQIHGNDLTGNIDLVFCMYNDVVWDRLWADCGGLAPEVNCSCCTVCCSGESQCEDAPGR